MRESEKKNKFAHRKNSNNKRKRRNWENKKKRKIRRAKLFEEEERVTEERIKSMNEKLIAKEREAREQLTAKRFLKLQGNG